jgi:predicted O-linked N-acetylglucosamine transferase (SPINDLY family)
VNRKQRRAAGKQGDAAPAAPPASPAAPGAGPALDQALAGALRQHQAGQFALAEQGYKDVLRRQPDHPVALTLYGILAQQTGNHEIAVRVLDVAIGANPNHAEAHAARGSALQGLGRIDDAVASFERALALKPDLLEAHANLGNALQIQGKLDEAAEQYRWVAARRPDIAGIHSNLGIVFQAQGKLDAAAECFARALKLKPDLVEAHTNVALVLMMLGRSDDAIAHYRVALELRPDLSGIHANLGMALQAQGKMAEAVEAYRRGLAVNPDDPAALCNLGSALQDLGRLDEARASFARALALKPDYAEVHSNMLVLANYDPALDDAGLLEAHRAFDCAVTAPLMPATLHHANDRDPARRLRIGYVSGDFCRHPVGYFILKALSAHDRAAVETWCYSGRPREDDLSAEIRARADHWRSMIGVADADLAAQIRADGIDILVDLSGHTGGNRLPVFGRKPAPVQVAWLGYFNTTGVGAIDYVLMDDATVPPGAERWFTEQVVRLPEGRFCYAPPDYAPDVAALPAATRGHITFGSFNNMSKVTADVIALWSAVLAAVPDARLLLKWKSLADAAEGARVRQAFGAHGIAPERLELRGPTPHAQMLAEYADVDIGLDPFPFCGGLTSCEALWMGVPIITLPGTRPVSRQTLGFLTQLGLPELAADSPERYVAIAAELAGDRDRLAALRAGLRARMAASSLCDGPCFTRGLEAAYRAMWRTWCATA